MFFSFLGLGVLYCDGWVSFVAANSVVHAIWVTALLSCQLYQVRKSPHRRAYSFLKSNLIYVFQVVILGMTTNERLNASRYKHFHRASKTSSWFKQSKYSSPFDRGICQNVADFFHIRIGWFGDSTRQSRDVDWKNEFNMDKWLNDDEEELLNKDGVNNV